MITSDQIIFIQKRILKKEQALIAGRSTGIGKTTAEILIEKEIEVALVGRNLDSLNTAKAELKALQSYFIFGSHKKRF